MITWKGKRRIHGDSTLYVPLDRLQLVTSQRVVDV